MKKCSLNLEYMKKIIYNKKFLNSYFLRAKKLYFLSKLNITKAWVCLNLKWSSSQFAIGWLRMRCQRKIHCHFYGTLVSCM
jgi:hypothetical protein